MANLTNEVQRHLNDDVIMQLSRQIGAQDPNQVKAASLGAAEILLHFISNNANDQQRGGGLYGAIEKDHDGGILGDLMQVLNGQKQVNNPKTLNGEGIVGHLLGNRQLEVAQHLSKNTGLHFFKTGVLMQLIAPVVMGVVGQKQKTQGLDLGGLAQILLGGGANQQSSNQGGGFLEKLLDRDGDGSTIDDLLSMGMKILKK